jgi:hypothetical protein
MTKLYVSFIVALALLTAAPLMAASQEDASQNALYALGKLAGSVQEMSNSELARVEGGDANHHQFTTLTGTIITGIGFVPAGTFVNSVGTPGAGTIIVANPPGPGPVLTSHP